MKVKDCLGRKEEKLCIDFVWQCRSQGIVVPNFFLREHIEEFAGKKLTDKEYHAFLWDCPDRLGDKISSIVKEFVKEWLKED